MTVSSVWSPVFTLWVVLFTTDPASAARASGQAWVGSACGPRLVVPPESGRARPAWLRRSRLATCVRVLAAGSIG